MKQTSVNVFFSLVYYSISLISNFIITSLLILSIGDELYSFYPLATNISGWLLVVSLAVNSMLSRHISLCVNSGEIEEAKKYYSTATKANRILALILIFPIIVIPILSGRILNIPADNAFEIKFLFFCVLLTVPVNMFATIPSTSTTVRNKLSVEYCGRIVQCCIKFSVIIIARHYEFINLRVVGVSILTSDIFLLIWMFVIKKKIMPEVYYDKRNVEKSLLRTIVSSGIWSSVTQLGNSLLFQSDLIISNIILGLRSAGTISIVLNIPSAVTSLTTMVCSSFMADFYREYAINKFSKSYLHRLQNAQMFSGGIIGTLIVIVLSYGREFFELWVPGNNSELLVRLSFFYLLPLIITAMFRSVGNTLIVLNQMKLQALLTLVNGLVNASAMFVLMTVTGMGIYSVVITTAVITLVWYLGFIPIYTSRKTGYNVFALYKAPLTVAAVLIVSVIVCHVSHLFLKTNPAWPDFIINVGISSVICYMYLLVVFYIYVNRK